MLSFIVFCLMIVVMIIATKRLYDFSRAFEKMEDFEISNEEELQTKATVIIPMRNEEDNIEACLQSVLNQDYTAHLLDIIVVDDHSEDNSVTLVQALIDSAIRI